MQAEKYQLYRTPYTQGSFALSPEFNDKQKCLEYLSRAYSFVTEKNKYDAASRGCEERVNEVLLWKRRNRFGKRIPWVVILAHFVLFALWGVITCAGSARYMMTSGGWFYIICLVGTGIPFLYHLIRLVYASCCWRSQTRKAAEDEKLFYDLHNEFQYRLQHEQKLREDSAYFAYLFPDFNASADKIYSMYQWIKTGTVRGFSEAMQYWEQLSYQNRMERHAIDAKNYARDAAYNADTAARMLLI